MVKLTQVKQIANELLKTYEGLEGTAINLDSWFCAVLDTKEYYKVDFATAKDSHSLAYYMYLTEDETSETEAERVKRLGKY